MKLNKIAKKLAIKLCGNIDRVKELMESENIKAEYWQGIRDAINGLNNLK